MQSIGGADVSEYLDVTGFGVGGADPSEYLGVTVFKDRVAASKNLSTTLQKMAT